MIHEIFDGTQEAVDLQHDRGHFAFASRIPGHVGKQHLLGLCVVHHEPVRDLQVTLVTLARADFEAPVHVDFPLRTVMKEIRGRQSVVIGEDSLRHVGLTQKERLGMRAVRGKLS